MRGLMISDVWPDSNCESWMCTPDTPSTPFVGWLAVVDLLRVLVILASLMVVLLTFEAIKRCQTRGQRARFIAFALWCAVTLSAYVEHMGDYPGVRMIFIVAATGYALYGVISFLRKEAPGQARPGSRVDDSGGGT